MNFAHIGNLVFERGDVEPVPDFRARVREAVGDMGGGVLAWGAPEQLEWIDAAPEAVNILGGIAADASGDFATIGDAHIEREDGESVESFSAARARGAIDAGQDFLIFGGLKPMLFETAANEAATNEGE